MTIVNSSVILESDLYRNQQSNSDGLESKLSTIWFRTSNRLSLVNWYKWQRRKKNLSYVVTIKLFNSENRLRRTLLGHCKINNRNPQFLWPGTSLRETMGGSLPLDLFQSFGLCLKSRCLTCQHLRVCISDILLCMKTKLFGNRAVIECV